MRKARHGYREISFKKLAKIIENKGHDAVSLSEITGINKVKIRHFLKGEQLTISTSDLLDICVKLRINPIDVKLDNGELFERKIKSLFKGFNKWF